MKRTLLAAALLAAALPASAWVPLASQWRMLSQAMAQSLNW
ncbi:hypothetical protein [Chromobacterium phragmitis]|uniref:Uncharacterized protein n=1 Tax=Chromobacterium phragmitis TaxID=2202141 RepID=A0ABV0IS30_9NEIS